MTDRFARIPSRAALMRDLRGGDLRVLIAIAAHADADGRAYPSMATLAALTGIRREDIPRSIRRLEQSGLLRCESRGGAAAVNVYVMIFDGAGVSADLRTGQGDQIGTPFPVSVGAASVRNGADMVSADLRTVVSAPVRTGCPHSNTSSVRTGADQTEYNKSINKHKARKRVVRHVVSTVADVQFEDFWRIYPSRGGHNNPKKSAREKFLAAVKRGVDPKLIIAAAENYANFIARSATAGRFVKQAEAWLNKECWEQYADPVEAEPLRAGMI